jgi:NAD+ diphosphatase
MIKGFTAAIYPPEKGNKPAWWFIFRKGRLLVEIDERVARLPLVTAPDRIGLAPERQQYLGTLNGQHCYAAEVGTDEPTPDGWVFKSLRQLFELLPEKLFWMAGTASQIVDWDRNHQYCGHCGAQMSDLAHERAKECPRCGLVNYPRIAPAVIVLVQHENRILLARAKHFPPGLYSVLAGFVEPGENLETAVRREIDEEVGVLVKDIRYFGSQPWPFPNSLMIAFTCHYDGGEIILDQSEMADAGWYTADQLPAIPPRVSIARQLIDWFVETRNSESG